jgi:large subunit ribosomal protein L9
VLPSNRRSLIVKLILTESIDRLGEAGEVVNVSDGYGRNFLLPARKAIPATGGNLKMLRQRLEQKQTKDTRVEQQAAELAKQLEEVSCTAVVQVGEDDRMFGSVTTQNIADLLKEKGFDLDRRRIILEEPIKALGIYTVPVQLHPRVRANVKLWVVKE